MASTGNRDRNGWKRAATRRGTCLAVCVALLAGCGSTDPAREPDAGREAVVPRPGSAPGPWTREFQREAVLIANKITIEGPADLLDHVVIRQEPGIVDVVQETTTEGLLQTMRRRPQAGAGEIRAWIDRWSIAAFQELVILQRPGEVPVRVLAEGSAVWVPTEGGGELRRPRLEFIGERGR